MTIENLLLEEEDGSYMNTPITTGLLHGYEEVFVYYKNILRRVLFEKVQHTGDCRLTGRFADDLNKPPAEKQLTVNNFQEEKQ